MFLAFLGAPLLVGTAEMASVIYDSIEIDNAAYAGAVYGMTGQASASDTAGIAAAAQAEAADFGANLTVTATTYWACSNAQSGARYTQTVATAACTGGNIHPLEFVQVVASATVTPSVHFPLLPANFTLSSTSVMEVEE